MVRKSDPFVGFHASDLRSAAKPTPAEAEGRKNGWVTQIKFPGRGMRSSRGVAAVDYAEVRRNGQYFSYIC